jgi:hypothetical protein
MGRANRSVKSVLLMACATFACLTILDLARVAYISPPADSIHSHSTGGKLRQGADFVGRVSLTNTVPVPLTKPLASTQNVAENKSLDTGASGNTDSVDGKFRNRLNVRGTPNYTNYFPQKKNTPFHKFTVMPSKSFSPTEEIGPLNPNFHPVTCSAQVEKSLTLPTLSSEQQEFCRWALSPTEGAVVVGQSWGKLTMKAQREDFDLFNCNSFSKGYNPSCDDAWGDNSIRNWRSSWQSSIACKAPSKSNVSCVDNDNNDRACTFSNVQMNFGLQEDVPRPSLKTPSRTFQNGFFSVDCKLEKEYFPFPQLYSNKVRSETQVDDFVTVVI